MTLARIEDAIEAYRRGDFLIVVDDEDRENEGDLIIAAEAVTPEIITFFSSEACGLICMPITEERARQLQLPLMVRDTAKTKDLVRHFYDNGVLVVGLAFPVVPKGDDTIRVQINAAHTEADIDAFITAATESLEGTTAAR